MSRFNKDAKSNRKVGEIRFEIENGKVVSYFDGKRSPDTVPEQSKRIVKRLSAETGFCIEKMEFTAHLIERILKIDDVLIFDEWLKDEHYEPTTANFFPTNPETEEITDFLMVLSQFYDDKYVKVDEGFIQDVLYKYELFVVENE